MKLGRRIAGFLAAGAAVAMLPVAASAMSIDVVFDSVSGAGPYTWQYHVEENSTSRVFTGSVPTATTSDDTDSTVADYFTIYDFAGFTGTFTAPAGWTLLTYPQGASTTGKTAGITDSAGINNLTLYWDGTQPDSTNVDGHVFTFESILGVPVVGSFLSEDHTSSAGTTKHFNQGPDNISVPAAASVPEPTTLLLMGSGLLSMGIARRRKS